MAPQQKFRLIELLAVLLTVVGAFAEVVVAAMFVLPHPHPPALRMRALVDARSIVHFLAIQSSNADSLAEAIRTADGRPAETTVERFQALVRLGLEPRMVVHRGDSRQAWEGHSSSDFDPPITAENISFALINHESVLWQERWFATPHTPILVDRNTSNDADTPRSVWSEQQPWEGVIAYFDGRASLERYGPVLHRVNFGEDGIFSNFHLFSGQHDDGHAPQVRMINP